MASNGEPEIRRQQYSVLPGTELLPLQDIRLDNLSNLANDESFFSLSGLQDSIRNDHYSASKDYVQRHDYGGFAPVPEVGFQENVPESDETCPL